MVTKSINKKEFADLIMSSNPSVGYSYKGLNVLYDYLSDQSKKSGKNFNVSAKYICDTFQEISGLAQIEKELNIGNIKALETIASDKKVCLAAIENHPAFVGWVSQQDLFSIIFRLDYSPIVNPLEHIEHRIKRMGKELQSIRETITDADSDYTDFKLEPSKFLPGKDKAVLLACEFYFLNRIFPTQEKLDEFQTRAIGLFVKNGFSIAFVESWSEIEYGNHACIITYTVQHPDFGNY